MSVVANVAINVDSRNAVSQLRQVETRAQATQKAFGALQQAAAAFGAGFALSRVIADVRELDTNLRRLGTVGGDVRALDKGLGNLSKQLDGVANKAELAAASYQALSAGFTDTAGNIKIVEAATKAAVGGLADTEQVTAVLTKTLNAYNMTGSQAIKVTDSISKAVEFGQVEWADYTSQLGRVASIAAIAGVSLDEVNAFIAAATKNGATAEIAFTGLGATLNSLLQPTKESQDAAKVLGIQWNLAGLQGKGFDGLIAELAQKMGTNQEAAVRLLGSQEALRGAFAAAAKGGKDYRDALEAIGGAAGKTEIDFQKMKGSLENTLKGLDTAFKNLSEALAKAFGPVIVLTIRDITSVVNGFASAMNAIPQPVLNAVGAIIKIVAQMLLLQKATEAFIALRAGFVAAMVGMTTATVATGTAAKVTTSAFAQYTMGTKALEAAVVPATAKLNILRGVLAAIAAIGVITVTVQILTQGQEAVAAAIETARLRSERGAGGAAAIFGGSATKGQKTTAQQTLKSIRQEQARYKQPGVIAAQTVLGPASQLFGIPTTAQAGARRTVLGERALRAQATMALPTRQETAGGGGGGGGGGGAGNGAGGDQTKKPKGRESEIPALQTELNLRNRIFEITNGIGQARLINNKATEAALQMEQILQERNAKIADINREKIPAAEKELKIKIATKNADQQLVEASLARQQAEQDRQKQLEEIVQGYANETALLMAGTPEIRQKLELEQQIAKWRADGVIKTDQEAQGIRDANAALEKQKTIRETLNAQRKMEEQLYQGIANQLTGGVGSAIDAVTRSTENLGQALSNIGQEILASVGKMLIFYGLAQAFGALGGGAGNPQGIFSALARGFGFQGAANGAYWSGGFQAFADGGVVTRPTMGMIGEGGQPEYVIPASKMRGAMNRYAAGARGSAVIPAGSEGGDGMTATMAAPGAIDVRYTVERINSVDYVTADQFQRGMQQAAAQGAAQGEQRTLRRLQSSNSTRKRLGI